MKDLAVLVMLTSKEYEDKGPGVHVMLCIFAMDFFLIKLSSELNSLNTWPLVPGELRFD